MLKYIILITLFALNCLSEGCLCAVYIVSPSMSCGVLVSAGLGVPKHVEAYDVCNVINSHALVGFVLKMNHQCTVMNYLKLYEVEGNSVIDHELRILRNVLRENAFFEEVLCE
jgi:hypothetical protein